MKTRESERGGAAPNVCSQTRRKLAKSKPSKTTFRPTPVSCGITERSLLCSIKSSLMTDFRFVNGLAGCYVSTIGKPHEYFDLTCKSRLMKE